MFRVHVAFISSLSCLIKIVIVALALCDRLSRASKLWIAIGIFEDAAPTREKLASVRRHEYERRRRDDTTMHDDGTTALADRLHPFNKA